MASYVHTAYAASDRLIPEKDINGLKGNGLIEAILAGEEIVPPLLDGGMNGMRKAFGRFRRYCDHKYPEATSYRTLPGVAKPADTARILQYLQGQNPGKVVAIVKDSIDVVSMQWGLAQELQHVALGSPPQYWRYGKDTTYQITTDVEYRDVPAGTMNFGWGTVRLTVPNKTLTVFFSGDPDKHPMPPMAGYYTLKNVAPPATDGLPTIPYAVSASTTPKVYRLGFVGLGTNTLPTDPITATAYGSVHTPGLVDVPEMRFHLQRLHKVVYTVDGEAFILQVSGTWGTIPGLTDDEENARHDESYSPVVMLQRDKIPFNKDKTSHWYTAVTRACKLLGMDADDFLDEVNKTDSGEPDRSDIYIHFGLGIDKATSGNNERAMESEYMVDYLRHMQATCKHVYDRSKADGTLLPYVDYYEGVIVDSRAGSWEGFVYHLYMENVTCFETAYTGSYTKFPTDFFKQACIAHNMQKYAGRRGGPAGVDWPDDKSLYWYRRAGPSTIRISAMSRFHTRYDINMPGFVGQEKVVSVEDYDATYFPIHNHTLDTVSTPRRETVIQRAFRCTVLLTSSKRLKWYQTQAFQIIALFIAVTLALFSGPIIGFIGKILGVSSTVATAVFGIVMGSIANFAAPLFGDKAWIFQLVLAIMVNPLILTNPVQYVTNMVSVSGWGTGMQFIANAASAASTVMGFYTKKSMSDMAKEMESFNKTAREKMQELEDKWIALSKTSSGDIDTDAILEDDVRRIRNFVFESVDTFYARSLQMHPGLEGVPLIATWASASLALSVNMDGTLDYSRNVVESITGAEPRWIG